jgi:hypothetical protein
VKPSGEELTPSFSVSMRKLTHYLLDTNHRVGSPKARFFLGRGFRIDQPDVFAAALLTHATCPAVRVDTMHGLRFVCDGPLACPDGTSPQVRTVWQQPPGGSTAELITAFPI